MKKLSITVKTGENEQTNFFDLAIGGQKKAFKMLTEIRKNYVARWPPIKETKISRGRFGRNVKNVETKPNPKAPGLSVTIETLD